MHQAEGYTVSMRSKEKRMTIAIFPSPIVACARKSRVARSGPKCSTGAPEAKRSRFVASYGISPYDGVDQREARDYFEAAVKPGAREPRPTGCRRSSFAA